MSKSIESLYRDVIQELKKANIEDSNLVALFIIEFVFSRKYLNLVSDSKKVTNEDSDRVNYFVSRFIDGEPLAYLFKQAMFRKSLYFIEKGVLIPRPETEQMVDYSIQVIQFLKSIDENVSVVELGVGSGVISIELASYFSDLYFHACDISNQAIEVAVKNKERFNVENLTLYHGDFFKLTSNFDLSALTLMVSNPPYISDHEYMLLDKYVLNEPKEALVANNDGLEIIFKSLDFCIVNAILYIAEIGHSQSQKIRENYDSTYFLNDINGIERFVVYIPRHYSWKENLVQLLKEINGSLL